MLSVSGLTSVPTAAPAYAGTLEPREFVAQPVTKQQLHFSPYHCSTTTTNACIEPSSTDQDTLELDHPLHYPLSGRGHRTLRAPPTTNEHPHTATSWQPHLLYHLYEITSRQSTLRPQTPTASSSGDATPASPPTMTEAP